MQKLIVISLTSFLFFVVVSIGQAEQCMPRDGSAQIYISDSHIGMGGRCNGADCRDGWHNMEDFRWHDDFKLFLNYLEKRSKSIDLIMVGDIFELWQDMAGIPCEDDAEGSDLGCNAKQAKSRIQEVGKKHKEMFHMLSDFIRTDKDNKIIMLPGNHDAALAMNSVAGTTKELFAADARKNICVDEDGMIFANSIFVEHGHQIEGDLNRYSKPLNGTIECIDRDGDPVNCNDSNAFVRRSWGENFVQNYYNDYENKFPVIDNYSSEGSGMPDGVKRGIGASSFSEKTSATLDVFSFFFTKQTKDHIISVLNDPQSVTSICPAGTAPCLDIDCMKIISTDNKIFTLLPEGSGELLQLIFDVPNVERPTLGDVYEYYSTSGTDATSELNNLLISTCIYWDVLKQKGENPENIHCSYKNRTLGAGATGIKHWFKGILDEDYNKVYEHIEDRAEQLELGKQIKYFIYGHTHNAEQYGPADGSMRVLNTGAWQRVVSAEGMQEIIKEKSKDFEKLTPNDLPPCYSFVASNFEGISQKPNLFWWTQKEPTTEYLYKYKPQYCK
jgi:UDP-2,3-diacylglucosamine pyrophosphatase LpxH